MKKPVIRLTAGGLCFVLMMLCAGCATIEKAQLSVRGVFRPLAVTATSATRRTDRITVEELEQLTYGFADRYLTYIITATEGIERDNPNPEQRRRASQVRLVQVSAIYDVVTNADPFTRLLDLLLVVTLQSHKWIEEDQAERWFGERARPLILASRKAREDIWQIAARTMTTDQLEVIDYLIWDWRRRNRDVELVSYVRFDDFAAERGKSIVADVKGGGGLLAPVGQATQAVDEMRLLAERAFFYAKRLPFLINWQVRAAVDDVLRDSDARELSAALIAASQTLSGLPQEIAREREALFAALDQRQPMFQSLTAQYRSAISDTTALVGALTQLTESSRQTLAIVDGLVAARTGRPFDIREYGATVDKVVAALQEANRLATATSLIVDFQPQEFDRIAMGGTAHAKSLTSHILDTAFWRGAALIIVFFGMLALYRLFSVTIERRRGAK
jgi:hypothetical protein